MKPSLHGQGPADWKAAARLCIHAAMSGRFAAAYLTAFAASFLIGNAAPAQEAPSVQVTTVALNRQQVAVTVTSYGTVSTREEQPAVISFPHAGQITEVDVRASQKVHAGDPLVTITADPAALQSYQQAVAAFNFAAGELARQRSLFAQRLATNSQVAAAERALSDAQVTLETERKLGHDKPTEVAKAPFDGFIAQVAAAPGDRLQPDAPILKLSRTDTGLLVTCGLSLEDAAGVAPGMTARIAPVLWSKAQPIEGTVRQLGASLNPTTKLIDVWIAVNEATAALVPGTTVSAVIVRSQHDGWVVPRNAVLHDQNGSYVFQVAGGRGRRVEVETGVETNQLTEISGDVDPSLPVVATGNYELNDGMAVRETALKVSMRDASAKGGR